MGLMRTGWREVLIVVAVFLRGAEAQPAQVDGGNKDGAGAGGRVSMAVELRWSIPPGETGRSTAAAAGLTTPDLRLQLSEGRVVDVIPWPSDDPGRGSVGPGAEPDGAWILGSVTAGRARARIEASLGADLVFRHGDQVVRVPVAAILERPQHTPARAPLVLGVERLSWDSLHVELGPGFEDGVVPPAAAIPLCLRFNILWPETGEVTVRTTATLRPAAGGEPVWSYEQREVVPANRLASPERTMSVPAPSAEGTYVLELRSAWEPVGPRDGSRLGRLIRRRKAMPVASTATRRLTLAVVAPRDPVSSAGRPATDVPPRETEVDTLDLSRVRNTRFTASGKTLGEGTERNAWAIPAEVILEATRHDRERDRLRSWITRAGTGPANLGAADTAGLAWSAVGLRVAHAQKPHRLTVTVTGGDPSSLGVGLVDPGGEKDAPRVVLDACASGPPILNNGPPLSFSWLVWPGTADPVLMVVNRNQAAPVRLGTVRLTELDAVPQSPPPHLPGTDANRALGLYLPGAHALERFGLGRSDPLATARNLVDYMGYCGASLVVLPDRQATRRTRGRLAGQAEEDEIGPDPIDLVLRLLQRKGYTAWLDLDLSGKDALPGLPPPDSPEALKRGLVRVDRQGLADEQSYHPIHPDVHEALKRRVEAALKPRGERTGFSGLLIQLGSGPTLLGPPDTGMDDDTFARFVKDTFGADVAQNIPGLGTTDPERFASRSKYVAGVGRMPWLTWRTRAIASLYADLAATARAASPGALLAVSTPLLDRGSAGTEARRVDLAGLVPSQAWRSVGLDLEVWPTGPDAPIVLRGVGLSTEALAHDLATSPELDARVAARPHRGAFLASDPGALEALPRLGSRTEPGKEAPETGLASTDPAGPDPRPGTALRDRGDGSLTLSALPLGDGAAADEPLGHALAALDARWVILASPAIAGHEDRVRRFAQVMRAVPAWSRQPGDSGPERNDFGVAVRSFSDSAQTYLQVANDTPYPIRLAGILNGPASAPVDDLGRGLRLAPQSVDGGRQLVIDLLPFGVGAVRIGAPGVHLAGITPYPSEAVLTTMRVQFHELSNQLARLNRGLGGTPSEPANPGFEPDPSPAVLQTENGPDTAKKAGPVPGISGGWRLTSGEGASVSIDRTDPHSGQGSLKLASGATPASVVSGEFVPNGHSGVVIQAYFKADSPEARVRVWIEGEAAGRRYLRRSEVTVGQSWDSRSVRATDLPAGALDTARIRLELMTPGTLWVDDLRVIGEATPRAVRLNAQRTLLAALQAYREQRFAEFARLASSHWAKHPSIVAAGRLARAPDPPAAGEAPGPGSSPTTALPPDRRLR